MGFPPPPSLEFVHFFCFFWLLLHFFFNTRLFFFFFVHYPRDKKRDEEEKRNKKNHGLDCSNIKPQISVSFLGKKEPKIDSCLPFDSRRTILNENDTRTPPWPPKKLEKVR